MTEAEVRDESAKTKGAAHVIIIGENEARFYLRPLNRKVLAVAMSKANSSPLEASEILFENHVIRELSDMAKYDEDSVYVSVMAQVNGLIEVKAGELKRL